MDPGSQLLLRTLRLNPYVGEYALEPFSRCVMKLQDRSGLQVLRL